MKIICLVLITIVFNFTSCAHHDNKIDHHHHTEEKGISYDGKCAYSVENSKFDIPGVPEFSLVHNNVTYYFSSFEKMELFKKDLPHNIEKANKEWSRNLK